MDKKTDPFEREAICNDMWNGYTDGARGEAISIRANHAYLGGYFLARAAFDRGLDPWKFEAELLVRK